MKTRPRPHKLARPTISLAAPLVALLGSLLAATPAHAHHPMGGGPVTTAFDGFLSGLAHPIIGIDHLAMILAIGVLAAAMRPGFFVAGAFVLAAMAGTGLHLLGLDLPGSELLVALSVVAVGSLLALRQAPASGLVLAIGAVAGLLHGYAYGESIFGAEPTPLVAYLAGFTAVQLAVAGVAYAIAKATAKNLRPRAGAENPFPLRPAGYVVAGAGLALLATQIAALALP